MPSSDTAPFSPSRASSMRGFFNGAVSVTVTSV
jgi:hypothetical protein